MDLFAMLSDNEPLMIDTLELGRSIPGAICLAYAGSGGSFTDPYQLRLDRKVRELTDGDNERPVVTLSWNAERWDGRNLALRLVALGYTKVHWYRGGREAWEMYGGQTADLPIFDW